MGFAFRTQHPTPNTTTRLTGHRLSSTGLFNLRSAAVASKKVRLFSRSATICTNFFLYLHTHEIDGHLGWYPPMLGEGNKRWVATDAVGAPALPLFLCPVVPRCDTTTYLVQNCRIVLQQQAVRIGIPLCLLTLPLRSNNTVHNTTYIYLFVRPGTPNLFSSVSDQGLESHTQSLRILVPHAQFFRFLKFIA